MGTLAKSEDPDEMQHKGLHRLLNLKKPSGTEKHIFFKKFYLWPLKVQNGQSHTYCINMYGKIHQNSKG